MCIEPPRPCEQPSLRPNSSAITAAGDEAAREREAVTAVAGDQQVVVVERVHDAGRRRLLPGRQVAVAADAGGLVLALGLRLEDAVEHHLLVEAQPRRRCEPGRGLHIPVDLGGLRRHRSSQRVACRAR